MSRRLLPSGYSAQCPMNKCQPNIDDRGYRNNRLGSEVVLTFLGATRTCPPWRPNATENYMPGWIYWAAVSMRILISEDVGASIRPSRSHSYEHLTQLLRLALKVKDHADSSAISSSPKSLYRRVVKRVCSDIPRIASVVRLTKAWYSRMGLECNQQR
jgi:hypothetical protein